MEPDRLRRSFGEVETWSQATFSGEAFDCGDGMTTHGRRVPAGRQGWFWEAENCVPLLVVGNLETSSAHDHGTLAARFFLVPKGGDGVGLVGDEKRFGNR